MDGGVSSLEAATRLGIRGRDAYRLLFAGELDGGPGRDGMVYFDVASIEAYLERHGYGVAAEPSTGSSTERAGTGDDVDEPGGTGHSRTPRSEAQSDTDEDGPSGGSVSS